jgi:phage gp36-like protein
MPNALPISLHPAGAEIADGVGAAVPLGDRLYATVTLNCTALTASDTLAVVIEASPTGDNWATAAAFPELTAPATLDVVIPVCAGSLRARWTFTGLTPSATFSVTGTAYQLYATIADLAEHGMPASALARFTQAEMAAACLASSDEANGYIASAYALPLTAWDRDLRKQVSCMAIYDLLSTHGFDPLSGKDSMIETRQKGAIKWLDRLANGQIRPVGIIDSAPEVREQSVYVETWQARGWRGWNC